MRNRASVLITVPCLQLPGGVANYYRTLRPLLPPDKVYFEVGARPGAEGRLRQALGLVADCWGLFRLLGRLDVGLVHLNPSLASRAVVRDGLFLLIAKMRGLPVLVFFRGWDRACEAGIRARWAGLFRFVYGRADAFVVLAQEFANSLRAFGMKVPIVVETTVVADEVFVRPAAEEARTAREAGGCNLLFMSRLDRNKGLLEAIDAVGCLAARFPGLTLVVAGDGPERAVAEARVRATGLECVRFVGHVDGPERTATFENADVFFFPTHYGEGMPNVVLEAMGFGLPVVTRPVGGVRDFFEDGRMGFLTESREPRELAGLLSRLVADPAMRDRMGQYNRDYARRRFSGSVVAARLLELYGRFQRQTAAD